MSPSQTLSTVSDLRRAYADTRYGQLHYAEVGTGPVVLLLHQTPRSHDEFREVQPLLATGHRVVAMDMLGFGASAALPAPQTVEQFAAGAFALLDAVGVPDAVVFGHHTGAVVGMEMAAAAPHRIRGLVLSSPPWTGPEYRAAHAESPSVDVADRTADGDHLTRLWRIRQPYYPAGRADLLDRFIRDALAPGVDPAEGHRACARYRMEERAPLVTAPTLVLAATADPFAAPHAGTVRAALVNARSAEIGVVEGGTVPVLEQAPQQVAALVLEFLRRLEG